MKRKTLKSILCLVISAAVIFSMFTTAFAADSRFLYEHDPRLNPSAMADVIADPTAIYGFRPNPDSKRLGAYAEYDWSDEDLVASSREARIAYHNDFRELYDLRDKLAAEGKGIEEIARAVSALRNEMRLRSYENNPEALESVKQSNLEAYGNEYGPTADSLYEKYGSWEMVLEKAFSTNSGMDACLGLYDDLYEIYVSIGQIRETYYTDAMQWCYDNFITDPITFGVYDPSAVCTRAEAVTLLWAAAGSPEVSSDSLPFADVSDDSYYKDAVCWAFENGITNGTSASTFSPDKTVSRAQMITLLSRYADGTSSGECGFTDVSEDAYYFDAVCWASETGIANGTATGIFSPDSDCIRANAVTFIWRCAA